jgi:hypothetical protein
MNFAVLKRKYTVQPVAFIPFSFPPHRNHDSFLSTHGKHCIEALGTDEGENQKAQLPPLMIDAMTFCENPNNWPILHI